MELAKQEGLDARLQEVCTVLINAFRLLTIYLKPVLPKLAEGVEAFLDAAPLGLERCQQLAAGQEDQRLQHLMQRIDPA